MSHEYVNEVLKVAADKEPSWHGKQMAAARAIRENPDLANRELLGMLSGSMKGFGYATPAGAGIGALSFKGRRKLGAAIGALIGASLGLNLGRIKGQYDVRKKFLKKRGITPRNFGLTVDITPEAKKKYIDAYRKK